MLLVTGKDVINSPSWSLDTVIMPLDYLFLRCIPSPMTKPTSAKRIGHFSLSGDADP